jgi:hypothetical protein
VAVAQVALLLHKFKLLAELLTQLQLAQVVLVALQTYQPLRVDQILFLIPLLQQVVVVVVVKALNQALQVALVAVDQMTTLAVLLQRCKEMLVEQL